MRALAFAVLAMVLVAGCLGGSDPEQATPPDVEPLPDTPDERLDMGRAKPHIHDAWGDADHLPLFYGTLTAGDCHGWGELRPVGEVLGFYGTHRVESGCARTGLPDKVVVPLGTQALQVDLNAQESIKRGGVRLVVSTNGGHSLEGDVATTETHNWTIPLESGDWDLPHQETSGFSFLLRAEGEVALFDGPLTLTVGAHKIPDWTAPLDDAHLDHWNLTDEHTFLGPGVMQVLDATVDVRTPARTNYVTGMGPTEAEPVALADLIPPGTQQVSLALVWDPAAVTCNPGHVCEPVGWLINASEYWNEKRSFASGPGYRLYRFHVDEDFVPDSPYATTSATQVHAEIYPCLEDDPLGWCYGLISFLLENRATARFAVYAWQDAIDEAKLRLYVGIPG